MSSSSSFVCEISGETVSSDVVVVVTPSGHICQKRLLLQKLAENGGVDPFLETTNNTERRPLSEDDLIELKQNNSSSKTAAPLLSVPPKNNTSSMAGSLQQLQAEYDAVILELFDTRQALQETRQELSQALYQNDAAVRVVARLAAERDAARGAALTTTGRSGEGISSTAAAAAAAAVTSEQEPAAKKAKLDHAAAAAAAAGSTKATAIPQDDLNSMLKTWEELQPTRKARQKEAAKKAVAPDQLAQFALLKNKKPSLPPKSTSSCDHHAKDENKTALCLPPSATNKVVLACSKYQALMVYDKTSDSWNMMSSTLSCACAGSSIDIGSNHIAVVGLENGTVDVVNLEKTKEEALVVGTCTVSSNGAAVVDVRCHPDGVHFVAATANGNVVLGRLSSTTTSVVATFASKPDTTYTAGTLHPDGLIYLAGTSTGDLLIWDFKSQSHAGTLTTASEDISSGAVTAVEFSNNGYHIAAAYGGSGHVLVWDLRKQKLIATLNNNSDDASKLESVVSVKFDNSGKYLAYSGRSSEGGGVTVNVTTIKEWGVTASLHAPKLEASAGLEWGVDGGGDGAAWIAAAALHTTKKTSKPQLVCFGL